MLCQKTVLVPCILILIGTTSSTRYVNEPIYHSTCTEKVGCRAKKNGKKAGPAVIAVRIVLQWAVEKTAFVASMATTQRYQYVGTSTTIGTYIISTQYLPGVSKVVYCTYVAITTAKKQGNKITEFEITLLVHACSKK